jgi:hypothetical protein
MPTWQSDSALKNASTWLRRSLLQPVKFKLVIKRRTEGALSPACANKALADNNKTPPKSFAYQTTSAVA